VAATGSTRAQVDSLLVAERTPRGFDEPLSAEQGGSTTLGELVSDPAAQDDFLHVVDRIEVEELHELTRLLDERERGIVSAHYGLGCPAQTLREIAGGLGVSVERVRQLEERALARLRDAFEPPDPEPELRELPAGDDPHELRQHLGQALATERVAEAEATDMLIAAHEVAACVWGDGGHPELVRIGHVGGRLVCEIFDRGSGFKRKRGLGLWIARRLSTRIEEHTSPAGHTVRLWI
jgi:hypothetical protein